MTNVKRVELWRRVEANRLRLVGFIVLFVSVMLPLPVAVIGVPLDMLARAVEADADTRWLIFSGTCVLVGSGIAVHVAWATLAPARRLASAIGAIEAPSHAIVSSRRALAEAGIVTGFGRPPALWVLPGEGVNAFVVAGVRESVYIGVTEGFLRVVEYEHQVVVFCVLLTRVRTWDAQLLTALSRIQVPIRFSSNFTRGATHPLALAMSAVTWFAGLGIEGACELAVLRADAETLLRLKDPRLMRQAFEKVLGIHNLLSIEAARRYPGVFFAWPLESKPGVDGPNSLRRARLADVGAGE